MTGARFKRDPPSLVCHHCGGRFRVSFDDDNELRVYHTLPWCEAFDRVETLTQAIDFHERCVHAEKPS